MKNTSVLIVEDEPVIRRGLQLFLQHRGVTILHMTDNGEEAISKTLELNPDLVLMDIQIRGLDGISAAHEIKHRGKSRVLMLTSSDNDDDIFASLNAGADGYVLKTAFAKSLELAIQTVRHGTVWLDPQIAQRILQVALSAGSNKSADVLSRTDKNKLQEVASSNCTDGMCLVQPDFVESLRRLRKVQ
jgi:DNA-binding NarL/FixJ family response regulator